MVGWSDNIIWKTANSSKRSTTQKKSKTPSSQKSNPTSDKKKRTKSPLSSTSTKRNSSSLLTPMPQSESTMNLKQRNPSYSKFSAAHTETPRLSVWRTPQNNNSSQVAQQTVSLHYGILKQENSKVSSKQMTTKSLKLNSSIPTQPSQHPHQMASFISGVLATLLLGSSKNTLVASIKIYFNNTHLIPFPVLFFSKIPSDN